MKYPDIIGSSDKMFRNYSYGKRPGKKLVKYSPVKAKMNKLTSSIKNLSLKKGVVKGIKEKTMAGIKKVKSSATLPAVGFGLGAAGGFGTAGAVTYLMGYNRGKKDKNKKKG